MSWIHIPSLSFTVSSSQSNNVACNLSHSNQVILSRHSCCIHVPSTEAWQLLTWKYPFSYILQTLHIFESLQRPSFFCSYLYYYMTNIINLIMTAVFFKDAMLTNKRSSQLGDFIYFSLIFLYAVSQNDVSYHITSLQKCFCEYLQERSIYCSWHNYKFCCIHKLPCL
jgi:hypothetical protein